MSRKSANVLFVCTGNAGRSQMGEAMFRKLAGDKANVFSAGVGPWPFVHPVPKKLMAEKGLSLEEHYPKHILSVRDQEFDYVITLGDPARDHTPELRGNPRRMHWDISDPADADGTPQQEAVFRWTMDRIEERLPELLRMVEEFPRASELHMQPGISTCIFGEQFKPKEHFPLLAEAGFKCIELNLFHGSDHFGMDNWSYVEELMEMSRQTDVKIYSVHCLYFPDDTTGQDSSMRRCSTEMIKYIGGLAAHVGAQVVTLHAWPAKDMEKQEADFQIIHMLQELEKYFLPLPCVIGWENDMFGRTAKEHLTFLRSLNPTSFGLVLDNGHCNTSNNTDAYLPSADLRICNLHLNDNDGEKDLHGFPGDGTFDWNGFRSKLEAAGYVGPLMIESMYHHRTDDMKSLLADAAASIEKVL